MTDTALFPAPAADHPPQAAPPAAPPDRRPAHDEQPLVEAELLVEDVSIDGMCGVY